MRRYLIENEIIDYQDTSLQVKLSSAYQRKIRPQCLCRPSGVNLYIACVGKDKDGKDKFVLKRMPNTGQDHSPHCDSYESPSELSGRANVENSAISEDQESGLTRLKLDFSLSKRNAIQKLEKGEPSEKSEVKANPTKLSIRSLLHHLYEAAGFNKWSPNMAGKRSWQVIRKYLLQSIKNQVTRNAELAQIIFLPETFSAEKKAEIRVRRHQFMSNLKKEGNVQPMGILIGEVKGFEPSKFGVKMCVKHMPDKPVYMDSKVYDRMKRIFSTEFSYLEENENIHLLVICTFSLSVSANLQLDIVSLMVVDQHWLPIEGNDDAELVTQLCDEGRHFIKGLRYNLTSSDVISSALLTDTPEPVALYILPIDAPEIYVSKLNAVVFESQIKSQIWNRNQSDLLRLPPAAVKQ